MEIKIVLGELLGTRSMTQRDLVKLTGLRPAAVSEIVNNQRNSVNKDHLVKICEALNITDLSELMRLEKE